MKFHMLKAINGRKKIAKKKLRPEMSKTSSGEIAQLRNKCDL